MTNAADLRAALIELTPGQQAAVEALANGATHAEAATAANVARETVSRWLGNHPGFQAALNLSRMNLAAETADRSRRVRDKALAVIEKNLDSADLSTALAVFRAVPSFTADIGPLDPVGILDAGIQAVAATVPPPPANRDSKGRIARNSDDSLTEILYDVRSELVERARGIALDRIAAAAGLNAEMVAAQ